MRCRFGHRPPHGAPATLYSVAVGPCTCPLRINIAGSPVDRHRDKKAWTRGLAWHPRGPFIPGDALTAGRVGVHRLCRPPPRAASHHSWVLTLPPAAAGGAHETTTLRGPCHHNTFLSITATIAR